MADDGIKSPDLTSSDTLTDLIGNDSSGRTRRSTMNKVATQLLGSGAFDAYIDARAKPILGLNASTALLLIITAGQSLEVSHGPAYTYPTLGVSVPTIDANTYAYDRVAGNIKNAKNIGDAPYPSGLVSPQQVRTSELARLTKAPVYDIPNAQGGLSILNWTNPIRGLSAPTRDMWSELEADVQAVLSILGAGNKIQFFFWNQGESDNARTIDWYYKELHDVLLPALRKKTWWSPNGRIVLQGKTSLPMRMTGQYSVAAGSGTITRVSGDNFGNLADLAIFFPFKVRVYAPDGSNNGEYTVSAVAGNEESATFSPNFSTTESKALFLTVDPRDHGQALPHVDTALRMCAEIDKDVSYTPVPEGATSVDGLHMDGMTTWNTALADVQRAIAAPAYPRTGTSYYFEQNASHSIFPRGTGGVRFEDVRDFGEALEKNGSASQPGKVLTVYLEDGDHEANEWYLNGNIWLRTWIVAKSALATTSNQYTNKMPTASAFGATEATNLAALRAIFKSRLVFDGAQGMVVANALGKLQNIMIDASDATYGLVLGDKTNNLPGGRMYCDAVWVHGGNTANVLAMPGGTIWAIGSSNGPRIGSSNGGSVGIRADGGLIMSNYGVSVRSAYGVWAADYGRVQFQSGVASDNATYDLDVEGVQGTIQAQSATYSTGNRSAGSASARGAIIYT